MFVGIGTGIIIRYFSPDNDAFIVGVQLLLAAIPTFLGGLVKDLI